ENGWLLDYTLEKAIESDLGLAGSYWAEPNEQHLISLMKQLYNSYDYAEHKYTDTAVITKSEKAYVDAQQLTWEYSAQKTVEFVKQVEALNALKDHKVAHITPINSKDGIAVYVQNVFAGIEKSFKEYVYISNSDIADRALEDKENVIRL